MSYVDTLYLKEKDIIKVVERVDGQRIYKDYPAEYVMYYDDPKGKHRTIYNTSVTKFKTNSHKEFMKAQRIHSNKRLWESDFKPVNRLLEHHYMGVPAPTLNVCFFDIEASWHPTKGYARPDDPFNDITSITVYLDWMDKLITLVVPPPSMTFDEAQEVCNQFENCLLFSTEKEMLETFLHVIEDSDVLTGWNSEGYDIPYLVMRMTKILGQNRTRDLCLWNCLPRKRMAERYGTESLTFDLVGRIHLDYMHLYRKYTYEERHSYSLDSIGEYEKVGNKIAYDGTLDELYNFDFYKFIDYNRQDTFLVHKIDKKLKFIDLANARAHKNTASIAATMGTVAIVDQAIINEAHSRGLIVLDRKFKDDGDAVQAAGAYVAHPKKGIHEYIGAIDINSLYPSTIRALNMSTETILGQIRPIVTDAYIANKMTEGCKFAEAWDGLFGSFEYRYVMDKSTDLVTVDWDDGRSETISAAKVHQMIFESGKKWTLSANGTIFSYETMGLIPGLLQRWYAERKVQQATQDRFYLLLHGLDISEETSLAFNKDRIPDIPEDNMNMVHRDYAPLYAHIEENNSAGILQFVYENFLTVRDGKIFPVNEGKCNYAYEFWNKQQQISKLDLNGTYGGLLNAGCRFNDHRLGQSTTLTGRIIAKHMHAHINQEITGIYDHDGDAVIYGDTDSDYFSVWPFIKDRVLSGEIQWNKEICVQLYDGIADSVNESFPIFMEKACNCPPVSGKIIRGGREIVASKGLFIKKKRYAVLVYDKEGTRLDVDGKPGKVKALGLDLKRSDTPKVVQNFLSDILMDVLAGDGDVRQVVIDKVRTFKLSFSDKLPWEKGTPKRVNKLTKYTQDEINLGKARMPGHVRGAMNWNDLRRFNHDQTSPEIVDGMKSICVKLRDNQLGYSSVSYPTDCTHLPQWFKDLPFDDDLMEATIVDKKVENLLGILNWSIAESTDIRSTFNDLFSFN